MTGVQTCALPIYRLSDRHRQGLFSLIDSLIDFDLDDEDLSNEIARAVAPARREGNYVDDIRHIADLLSDPSDRYWCAVYLATSYLNCRVTDWELVPFLGLVERAFALPSDSIERAFEHASRLLQSSRRA